MINIKVLFEGLEEKGKLIKELQHKFEVLKVSKEYKKEGPYRRIHIDLRNK